VRLQEHPGEKLYRRKQLERESDRVTRECLSGVGRNMERTLGIKCKRDLPKRGTYNTFQGYFKEGTLGNSGRL